MFDNNRKHRTSDVVILSAGFGLGHLSAAQALRESLTGYAPGLRIEEADLLELLTPYLSRPLYGSYSLMVNHAAPMYNYFWERKEEDQDVMTSKAVTRLLIPALARYMSEACPRIAISTFPLSSYYLSQYKALYGADFQLVTCVTDVVCRREWLHSGTDLYLVASHDIKTQMVQRGLPENRIEVGGIPVRKAFLSPPATAKKPRSLENIDDEDFVILFMGGGLGKIPRDPGFYNWLSSLPRTSSLLLTAHNTRLRQLLNKARFSPSIKVLGYEPETAPLMRRANLLVTSAGGVTLFEAIASELPVLVYQPALGQEIENARFMEKNQLGRICHNMDELKHKSCASLTIRA